MHQLIVNGECIERTIEAYFLHKKEHTGQFDVNGMQTKVICEEETSTGKMHQSDWGMEKLFL